MAAVAVNAPAACCSVARSAALLPPRPVSSSCAMPSTMMRRTRRLVAVAAVGDVAAEGNTYLIAGAVAVALVGTAFPILFSRKDTCPECDGAGFIRKGGATLRANAARKDEAQIVCPNCNGLGKLGQIDK
ncbi:hypothetical protein PR202_gb25184 [Eleusine coracana subsp. coracana]|uniref:Uncharacterized protein n=1 Tax=Eleusine coracana subsp. coracana TaxID=191504 RepID=A0AAV5FNL1_ELECO|nr:hypothetical protein QOZ80_5BG0456530 [Eleusine coracana subsp. coracana]GJN36335.1 hypothetical protein PR202_gb25184 [Eleusine coracana subsp. coracana]